MPQVAQASADGADGVGPNQSFSLAKIGEMCRFDLSDAGRQNTTAKVGVAG
jgi:hypothetical protein